MLEDKIKHYELTGKILKNYPSQYKEKYTFLKEIDAFALIGAQNALQTAYKNFFEKRTNFPRFKSKNTANRVIQLIVFTTIFV